MTRFEKLLAEIEQSDIFYIENKDGKLASYAERIERDCCIFFKESAFETGAERYEALAHEKAHCDSGAFYTVLTPMMTVGWLEQRAWKRMIADRLPIESIAKAYRACKTTEGVHFHEMAECLGITEGFLKRAIEIYIQVGENIT